MAIYEKNYTIFITDADLAAQYQGQFPNGILTAPAKAAVTYSAPVNPAPPTFGEGQCIWTGSIDTTLPAATDNITIAPGFIYSPDNSVPIQALAGAPGGTLRWRGWFLRRGGAGPATKEFLQTHRWMVGFERANNGDQLTGNSVKQFTRAASRTLEGMGLAMRSPANQLVTMSLPTTGSFPTTTSWERIYVCLRAYPTANEMIWGSKGSSEAGLSSLLMVSPQGQLIATNMGNQAFPGTIGAQGGQLPLNQWVKLDVLTRHASGASGGSGNGSLFVSINGVQTLSMRGNGPGGTVAFGSGGILNAVQNHVQSSLGNSNTPSTGLEIDYDDWTNKTQPLLFTGDDWTQGTHIHALTVTGFDTGNGTWAGDFRTLDGTPVNGQVDSVSTSLANQVLSLTTDYQDRQVGCSGLQFGMFHKTASGTSEQLGWLFNGGVGVGAGGIVYQNVTTSSGVWSTPVATSVDQILYSAGGAATPPVLGSVGLRYQRDAVANLREINVVYGAAEFIGVWGAEDPINLANPSGFPPRQGPHNSPYYDSMTGQSAFSKGMGVVEVMAGTYVGNDTGQDVVIQEPAHWIWIRPLTGGTGGSRWWSSCLAGHDPLKETPNKGNLVRAFQTNNTAGPSGYKFRVSGNNANSNANGVTYQYVAFSDRAMRFVLNGAYLKDSANASFVHNLFDSGFTPLAGFLLPEIGSNVATTGFYFKGPGMAANAASLMDSAVAASICAFGAGTITPKTSLNLADSQTAYSLWRTTDGDGVSGPVALMTYTGDGTGARNIAVALGGRSPILAIVQPDSGVAYQRDPSHAGSNSMPINSSVASTTAITAGAANQITVGATLNVNLTVYSVFVLAGAVAGGWTPNPAEPIPLVDPIPPTAPFPPTTNGWWSSAIKFTGAATLVTYPPLTPRDARDWQKINTFATGNAGFYAGFPAPGVTINNFFIYAGNDYAVGSTQPTIRIFDGRADRLMITVPDVAGVKAIAIMAMITVNGIIYFTTLDSGSSSANWAGRVFSFNPDSLQIAQIGASFSGGEVPYALCWHMGRLFLGTNKGDGTVAKIYWFRIGQDLVWTQDYAITTSGVGGCLSLASYQGQLFVGCNATAAMGTNKILVRDTAGAYTTSFTLTSAGTFRASNGVPAMVVFNDKLYATFWNPDTVPDCYIKMFDGAAWLTVYTGAAGTVRPFVGLFVSKNTLFVVGGGSGLSACLLSSPDGTTYMDLSGFLTGPATSTAIPIIAQIGA